MLEWIIIILLAAVLALKSFLSLIGGSQGAGDTAALEDFLFSLVINAESLFGGKTGEAKRAYVVRQFYADAPEMLRNLVSGGKLTDMIESAVSKMKDYFTENPEAGNILSR
jgi:hypothetical protein